MYHIPSITVEKLHALWHHRKNICLIDVREPDEHAQASIEGSILVPLSSVPSHIDKWPKDQEIFVHCKAGGRSARAVQYLQDHGFTHVTNVTGGMDAWIQQGFPVVS